MKCQVFELVMQDEKCRNVICHGDLWSSNVLFKYSDKKPNAAVLIDFQMSRFCPPAHDAMMFLHLSLNKNQRNLYAAPLLQLYYDTLRADLSRRNLDIEEVVPPEEFKRTCQRHDLAGCAFANLYYPITHMNIDLMKQVFASQEKYVFYMFKDRSREVQENLESDAQFRAVMNDAMEYLSDDFL